jgi:DNA-binding SARP family transcriptional activator
MRLQALSGGKADALRSYHTWTNLLEQKLGVTPDKATHDLYEQLLHAGLDMAPAPTSEPATAATPLVGRNEEWSQLQRAWQATIDWHFTTDDERIKFKRLYPFVKVREST